MRRACLHSTIHSHPARIPFIRLQFPTTPYMTNQHVSFIIPSCDTVAGMQVCTAAPRERTRMMPALQHAVHCQRQQPSGHTALQQICGVLWRSCSEQHREHRSACGSQRGRHTLQISCTPRALSSCHAHSRCTCCSTTSGGRESQEEEMTISTDLWVASPGEHACM